MARTKWTFVARSSVYKIYLVDKEIQPIELMALNGCIFEVKDGHIQVEKLPEPANVKE